MRRDAITLEGELDDVDPESLVWADSPFQQRAIHPPSRSQAPGLNLASVSSMCTVQARIISHSSLSANKYRISLPSNHVSHVLRF
jgi:hypothetical protein